MWYGCDSEDEEEEYVPKPQRQSSNWTSKQPVSPKVETTQVAASFSETAITLDAKAAPSTQTATVTAKTGVEADSNASPNPSALKPALSSTIEPGSSTIEPTSITLELASTVLSTTEPNSLTEEGNLQGIGPVTTQSESRENAAVDTVVTERGGDATAIFQDSVVPTRDVPDRDGGEIVGTRDAATAPSIITDAEAVVIARGDFADAISAEPFSHYQLSEAFPGVSTPSSSGITSQASVQKVVCTVEASLFPSNLPFNLQSSTIPDVFLKKPDPFSWNAGLFTTSSNSLRAYDSPVVLDSARSGPTELQSGVYYGPTQKPKNAGAITANTVPFNANSAFFSTTYGQSSAQLMDNSPASGEHILVARRDDGGQAESISGIGAANSLPDWTTNSASIAEIQPDSAAISENQASANSTTAKNASKSKKVLKEGWLVVTHIRFEEIYRTTKTVLGYGLNGPVYLGYTRTTNRKVAIKTLQFNENLDYHKNEIDVYLPLDHPNIAKLYKAFEIDEECIKMVMEHCSGGELYEILSNSEQFSESSARPLAFQMAKAVRYLHDNNVLHRDLTLTNWLFSDTDRTKAHCLLKLIDFGLSVKMKTPMDSSQSSGKSTYVYEGDPNEVVGTLYYQAPEILVEPPRAIFGKTVSQNMDVIWEDGTPKDASANPAAASGPSFTQSPSGTRASFTQPYRLNDGSSMRKVWSASSDLWSLGVIFYILVSGSPPFMHEDPRSLKESIIYDRVQFPQSVWKPVSIECIDLIRRLLEKDPKRRIRSSEEVVKCHWFAKQIDPLGTSASITSLPQVRRKSESGNFHQLGSDIKDREIDRTFKKFDASAACGTSSTVELNNSQDKGGDAQNKDSTVTQASAMAGASTETTGGNAGSGMTKSRQMDPFPDPTTTGAKRPWDDDLLPFEVCQAIRSFALSNPLKQLALSLMIHSGWTDRLERPSKSTKKEIPKSVRSLQEPMALKDPTLVDQLLRRMSGLHDSEHNSMLPTIFLKGLESDDRTDGKGNLSADYIKSSLQQLPDCSDEQSQDIVDFLVAMSPKTNALPWSDFLTASARHRLKKQDMYHLFRMFDVDGNGRISVEDLERVLGLEYDTETMRTFGGMTMAEIMRKCIDAELKFAKEEKSSGMRRNASYLARGENGLGRLVGGGKMSASSEDDEKPPRSSTVHVLSNRDRSTSLTKSSIPEEQVKEDQGSLEDGRDLHATANGVQEASYKSKSSEDVGNAGNPAFLSIISSFCAQAEDTKGGNNILGTNSAGILDTISKDIPTTMPVATRKSEEDQRAASHPVSHSSEGSSTAVGKTKNTIGVKTFIQLLMTDENRERRVEEGSRILDLIVEGGKRQHSKKTGTARRRQVTRKYMPAMGTNITQSVYEDTSIDATDYRNTSCVGHDNDQAYEQRDDKDHASSSQMDVLGSSHSSEELLGSSRKSDHFSLSDHEGKGKVGRNHFKRKKGDHVDVPESYNFLRKGVMRKVVRAHDAKAKAHAAKAQGKPHDTRSHDGLSTESDSDGDVRERYAVWRRRMLHWK